jgi:hypothetical protein
LQVVSQIAQRWGTRRTGTGKVVWCELPVPSRHLDEPATHLAAAAGDEQQASEQPDGQQAGRQDANVNGRTDARHGASQHDVLNPA